MARTILTLGFWWELKADLTFRAAAAMGLSVVSGGGGCMGCMGYGGCDCGGDIAMSCSRVIVVVKPSKRSIRRSRLELAGALNRSKVNKGINELIAIVITNSTLQNCFRCEQRVSIQTQLDTERTTNMEISCRYRQQQEMEKGNSIYTSTNCKDRDPVFFTP